MIDHHREAIPLIPTHSKTFSNMLNVGWLLGYADVCSETTVTCGAVTAAAAAAAGEAKQRHN